VYLIELAREQRAQGEDVTIATGGDGPMDEGYREVATRYIRVSSLQRRAGIHDAVAIAAISRLARDHQIVHAHASKALAAAVLSRPLHRRPVIWTAHGYDSAHADFDPRVRGSLGRVKAALARGTSAMSVASDNVRAKALAAGVAPERVRVIYTGVRQERLLEVPPPEGPFTVGAAGRLVPLKGFDRLVEAMGRLAIKGVDVRAVLYGTGPEEDRLRELIAALAIADRFALQPPTTDLAAAFAQMHVVAVPSIVDSFPLVPCEAMVAGRPIIVSRVGGLPDALTEGVHGWVVPAGDADALAAAIERAAADPAAAHRMGLAAREYASARYRWDRVADEYEALYAMVSA
jgi:glycosyltransferase involved in cell wall biosynthesis